MINLLPPIEKEFLQTEQMKRLIVLLGAVVLTALVCLVLVLFSIKIYISGRVEFQRIILSEAERDFKISESQLLEAKIELANSTFSKINSFYRKEIYFSKILDEISQTLSEKTYLTSLSFNPLPLEQNFGVQISLSGVAPNRDTLFKFKNNLEAKDNFQDVYFPPANWVKPVNIDFNVTLKWIFL